MMMVMSMRTVVTLVMLLGVGGLVACGAQPRTGSGSSSDQESVAVQTEQPLTEMPAGRNWRLADSSRPSLQLPEAAKVTIRFDEERLQGDSGCNQFVASYSIGDDGRFELGPVAATKRGCPGPRSEVERAWFEALRGLQWISRDGEALKLHLAEGDALRFVEAVPATE